MNTSLFWPSSLFVIRCSCLISPFFTSSSMIAFAFVPRNPRRQPYLINTVRRAFPVVSARRPHCVPVLLPLNYVWGVARSICAFCLLWGACSRVCVRVPKSSHRIMNSSSVSLARLSRVFSFLFLASRNKLIGDLDMKGGEFWALPVIRRKRKIMSAKRSIEKRCII